MSIKKKLGRGGSNNPFTTHGEQYDNIRFEIVAVVINILLTAKGNTYDFLWLLCLNKNKNNDETKHITKQATKYYSNANWDYLEKKEKYVAIC